MSSEIIKYAFIAGELSPTLFGRTDLTKYDLGLSLGYNWFIDYRGGITTRPGTEFLDYIKHDHLDVRMMEFQFSPDLSNTYVLMFGHDYIRFIQNGAYVLEEGQIIGSLITGSGKVLCNKTAHGYANGDWVKFSGVEGVRDINGRSFAVSVVNANQFELLDPSDNSSINRDDQTYVSGGTVYRIYEITTDYAAEDLAQLKGYQMRDLVRLTHPDFSIMNLKRLGHTNWTLTAESISGAGFTDAQWGLNYSAHTSGTAKMSLIYTVAAVMADGQESVPATPIRVTGATNFSIEEGNVTLIWNTIPGAIEYIVYRSIICPTIASAIIPAGSQLGFLGRTRATFFNDSNIVPDFTKVPFENYNPFAPFPVKSLELTAGGTGYSFLVPITVTGSGGGSGFSGYGVVDETGAISNTVITSRGQGYEGTITVTFGGSGSGATATAEIGEGEGVYPSLSTLFQQRQMYAASYQQPLTFWASQIKRYSVFDTSTFVVDSDSYEFEVDASQVAPILHFKSLRGGLLMFSQVGIWLLSGGSNGSAVTPSNALADPQSYTGVSAVPPIQVGSDLLYIEGKGYSVRLLSYNDFSKVYSGEDKSILSNHLFAKNKQIVSWSFAENPYKMVLACRTDGALLMFTTVKEQDVYAWTWGETKGWFRSILCINEEGQDVPYTIVERIIQGKKVKYLERLIIEEWTHVEDSFCVDAGLRYDPPQLPGNLTVSIEQEGEEGTYVTLNGNAGADFTGKLDWWIRTAGGIFVIKTILDATTALAKVIMSATELMPGYENKIVQPSQDWYGQAGIKEFTGLQHIEGEMVSILGDGNVFPQQQVVDGKVTLPDAVSKARIGLGFTCRAQTLPPTVPDLPIESRRKRMVSIAARLYRTRGLMVGRTLNELYPIRERKNELYGAPTELVNGIKYQMLSTDWDEETQAYFVQENPLPASILGLVPDLEVGDDTN